MTECYKTGHWSNKPQITCANIPCWPQRKSHLLRKTPPSTGDSESLAEIQYSLSVVVTGKSTVKQVSNCPLQRLLDNEDCIQLIADYYQDSKYSIPFICRPDTEPKTIQAAMLHQHQPTHPRQRFTFILQSRHSASKRTLPSSR